MGFQNRQLWLLDKILSHQNWWEFWLIRRNNLECVEMMHYNDNVQTIAIRLGWSAEQGHKRVHVLAWLLTIRLGWSADQGHKRVDVLEWLLTIRLGWSADQGHKRVHVLEWLLGFLSLILFTC